MSFMIVIVICVVEEPDQVSVRGDHTVVQLLDIVLELLSGRGQGWVVSIVIEPEL